MVMIAGDANGFVQSAKFVASAKHAKVNEHTFSPVELIPMTLSKNTLNLCTEKRGNFIKDIFQRSSESTGNIKYVNCGKKLNFYYTAGDLLLFHTSVI